MSREFFATRTLAEALDDFNPALRTPAQTVPLAQALYTSVTMPGTVEVLRPVAPGGGIIRADDDVAAGAVLVPAGRPLRAADLGMLAAAGITEVMVHTRPRVAVLSTGDEVVPPATVTLRPGQVRDAIAPALAGLVLEAGGSAVPCGIVPDDPAALRGALRAALAQADLVVISAGSSVGARLHRAGRRDSRQARHLLPRPRGQTRQAYLARGVRRRAGDRFTGQPAVRLGGVPATRVPWYGASRAAPPAPEPSVIASLTRDVPSQAGRRDTADPRVVLTERHHSYTLS